jgi:hypothetical protein
MAVSKRTKSKSYQRVHKFPTAKGKIVAEVELSLSPDYNIIEIVFQDKTSLNFQIEPASKLCLNWSTGNLANTNLSNAGDLCTASNSEPAERRVFNIAS